LPKRFAKSLVPHSGDFNLRIFVAIRQLRGTRQSARCIKAALIIARDRKLDLECSIQSSLDYTSPHSN
jgi:hypothetical protein